MFNDSQLSRLIRWNFIDTHFFSTFLCRFSLSFSRFFSPISNQWDDFCGFVEYFKIKTTIQLLYKLLMFRSDIFGFRCVFYCVTRRYETIPIYLHFKGAR